MPKGFVLVIDDEKAIHELIEAQLKRAGYADQSFETPEEALFYFEHHCKKTDLVIVDLTIPGMGAIHFSERLLNIKPDIPIILITGHSPKAIPEEKASLFRKVLFKPFSKEELWEAVESVLPRQGTAADVSPSDR
jgi:two-component SAPR family response regulator